jgi:hypothetical protein
MKIRETITLSRIGDSAERALRVLSPSYLFERSGSSLIIHQDYRVGAVEDIAQRLAAANLTPRLFHNIYPEFEEADFSEAPLVNVAFPDVSISGEPMVLKCPECGTRRTSRDYGKWVRRVSSAAPVLSVNGAVDILTYAALDQIRDAGLRGLEDHPFDEEGRYSYLAARTELGEALIHTDETRGYRGRCGVCGRPLFDVHFGPFRFSRGKWSGEDFAWAEIIDRVVVSHAAYAQLVRMGTGVMRLSPVVLE